MFLNPFKDILIHKIKNQSFNPMLHIAPFLTDDVEKVLKELKTINLTKEDRDGWGKFYEQHKDKPLVLYETLCSKDIHPYLESWIINPAISAYTKADSYTHEKHINKLIMYKGLERELDDYQVKAIFNALGNDLFDTLQSYTTFPDKETGLHHPCQFSQKSLKIIGDCIMPYKKYKTRWYQQPFRLISDEKYLQKILDNPKCNETIRESIVNNTLVSDNIRMEAFNGGVNFDNIIYAPKEAKDIIFNSIMETYTDLNVNPVTRKNRNFSKSEIKVYNRAINAMSYKLNHRFFNEEHQLDLAYRIYDLHGGKEKDCVLGLMFKYTDSKKVLEMANMFHLSSDVEIAYQNPLMDKEMLMKRSEELFKKLNKNKTWNVPEAKYNTFVTLIKNHPLSDENYQIILNSGIDNNLLSYCAGSYYTPKHILDDIIKVCDKHLASFNDIGTKPRFQYKVDYLNEVKWIATFNKVIKECATPEECEKMIIMLNRYKINYRTQEKAGQYHPTTQPYTLPENDCDYIELKELYNTLPQSSINQKELLSGLEKEMEKHKEDSLIYAYIKEAYMEISEAINVHNLVESEYYEPFNLPVLEKIQKDIINEFCCKAENDISIFYDNFNELLTAFSNTQFQIDLKEMEKERNKETKEYDFIY